MNIIKSGILVLVIVAEFFLVVILSVVDILMGVAVKVKSALSGGK